MNNQDDELDKILHKIKFGTDKQYYSLDWGRTAILAWHNQQLEEAVIEVRIDELRRLVPSPVAEMASIDHSDELIRLYEYINNRFAKLSKSKEE